MNSYITAGGFGDSAMSYAKLKAIEHGECIIHHLTRHSNLKDPIEAFYKSQDINGEVFIVDDSNSWCLHNKDNYDSYLGTHWFAKNDIIESWEINPFPEFKYTEIENIDIVINPFSGVNDHSGIEEVELIEFCKHHDNVTLVGKAYDGYEVPNSNNKINKTEIDELVNIICSSNIFIGVEGFSCFVAAMAKKKVFAIPRAGQGGTGLDNRQHPKWDLTRIQSIKDYE